MLNAAFKQQLEQLSLREKLEVFDAIRETVMPPFETGFPELSASQEKELSRRAEAAAADPQAGSNWTEVRARLQK